MPRNGAGGYNLPTGNPVVTGTTIASGRENNTNNDLGAEIANSLAKDGQTTPTANLPMGNFRHTGVGSPSAYNQYATAKNVIDDALNFVQTVGGTANAITLAPAVSPNTYVTGQYFSFLATTANTSAVTVNVSSMGVKDIKTDTGTALKAGDIVVGQLLHIKYNGTFFALLNKKQSLIYQTMADLKAEILFFPNALYQTLGYNYVGDGGGNTFYCDLSSVLTDNGGTIIKPTSVSGAGRWIATNPELTTLLQWGCFADGTITDDSAKINAYLTYMAANGWKATGTGTYRIDSKITIKGNADFSGMNVNVYGSPTIAVEVSTGSAANPTDYLPNLTVILPKTIFNKAKVSLGWDATIGVRTVNLYSCIITLGNIQGFGIGFQPTAYGSVGNVYNTYNIGWLENNNINCDLTPAAATSYVNENLFIGGRYSHNSGEGTNVVGVRQIRISKSTLTVNNNVFTKPSIEGNVPEYHIECGGSYNQFNQARWEAATPKMLYTGDNTNQGSLNVILGGYNAQNIVYTYIGTTGTKNKTIIPGGGYETINVPIGIQNLASSSNDIYRFYEAGTIPETAGATDWSMGIGSTFTLGKRKADTYARMKLEFQNGRIYFDNGTTASPTKYIGAFGNDDFAFTNHVSASVDNTYTCGRASQRWTVVYATTGAINTSDERSKQQITQDIAPELKAWAKVEFCKYKLNDSVEEKCEKARWHFGVIAQQVKKAFEDEGLDPFAYGILCYDKWDAIEETLDADGVVITPKVEAGNRYGIRYEEALILECAYLRSKIK